MTPVEMVNKAAELVIRIGFSLNKKDYSGFIDVLHPLGVGERVKHYGEIAQTLGILHDVEEDYGLTREDLLEYGFPKEVVDIVDILTRKEEEPYEDYITRVLTNPLAIIIKIADLQYNLNRVDYGLSPEKANKLRTRWVAAMRLLRDRLIEQVG
jgi:(p)ppGpp synthase/HD superfamily hydrolase